MKITNNQIYMAASTIAANLITTGAPNEGILQTALDMAIELSLLIPDENSSEKIMPISDLKDLMWKYTYPNRPTNRTRLSNLLQVDAGFPKNYAEALIDRAAYIGIIEESEKGTSKIYTRCYNDFVIADDDPI